VVVTRRSINCDAGGRGVRPIELIIRNYWKLGIYGWKYIWLGKWTHKKEAQGV
jgi:hypothetical protein